MGIAPTKAQVKAIDGLIDGSLTLDTVNKRTFEVLIREGWVHEGGIVSQTGLAHTTHPVVEMNVIVLGKPLTYTHAEGTKEVDTATGRAKLLKTTVTFPKGTEIIPTFVHGKPEKPRTIWYEGMVNMNGKLVKVHIYRQPSMKFVKRLMPDKKAIENGRTD